MIQKSRQQERQKEGRKEREKARFLATLGILFFLVVISTAAYLISNHLHDVAKSEFAAPGRIGNSGNLSDPSTNIVIYLDPHADDETLTFGIPILNDIHEGKKVYIILLTNGIGSAARDVLNGKSDKQSSFPRGPILCPIHHVIHNPLKEHYLDPWITDAVFERVRDEEFIAASEALGVPRSQLELLNMSKLSTHSLHILILQLKQRFPNATFKSMSPLDGHPQHAITGSVLATMYANHELSRIQNNFGSVYTDRIQHHYSWSGQKIYLEDAQDRAKLLRAIYVYEDWDPKHGKYAVGYHSVRADFNLFQHDMYTKIFDSKQK